MAGRGPAGRGRVHHRLGQRRYVPGVRCSGQAAPDRPTTPGWKWALCPAPGCGWQSDRDHGAWRRIAARGLAHQAKTIAGKNNGTMAI
jgi:hypothetical protein